MTSERHYEPYSRPDDASIQLVDDKMMTSLKDYSYTLSSWRSNTPGSTSPARTHHLYCDTSLPCPYERCVNSSSPCLQCSDPRLTSHTVTQAPAAVLAKGQSAAGGPFFLINPIKQQQLVSWIGVNQSKWRVLLLHTVPQLPYTNCWTDTKFVKWSYLRRMARCCVKTVDILLSSPRRV